MQVLTHKQHKETRRKAWPTPAVPTIHVKRRNKITPRIFCRVGRYTPIMVPILADWRRERDAFVFVIINTKQTLITFFLFFFPFFGLGTTPESYWTILDSILAIRGRLLRSSCTILIIHTKRMK